LARLKIGELSEVPPGIREQIKRPQIPNSGVRKGESFPLSESPLALLHSFLAHYLKNESGALFALKKSVHACTHASANSKNPISPSSLTTQAATAAVGNR
jgi:hypothetical protein